MAITFSDWFLCNMVRWFTPRVAGVMVSPSGTLKLHLYTNAGLVPSDDTLLGDFTEAAFCGYAAQDLINWTDCVEDEPNLRYKDTPDPVRFCATCELSPCITVYGIYATLPDGSQWVFADQTWPGGIQFCHPCDCLQVQPTVTDEDVTPGPHA